MAKTEGCWASALGDCDGPLTGEHLISMAVWEPPPGSADNREGKEELSIRMVFGPDHPLAGVRAVPLKDLVAPTLCKHHNHASHPIDETARKFRLALLDTERIRRERESLLKAGLRGGPWTPHRAAVDGPALERWFYKTVINIAAWQQNLPIGAADAPPARPTRDLTNRVFTRGVPARRPMGLGLVAQVGDEFTAREAFSFLFYDRDSTHISGCLVLFRGLVFVVKLEEHDTPEWVFQRVLGRPQASVVQPLRRIDSCVECDLYLNWPNEPKRKKLTFRARR